MSKIKALSTYAYDCQAEYRELEDKYNKALAVIEKLSSKFNTETKTQISTKIASLNGKTIDRICILRGEFGRTYDQYAGFACSDGSRIMLSVAEPYSPDPTIEEMKKSTFFTEDEIAKKEDKIIKEKQYRQREAEESKRRELDRLRKELGEDKQ
jgi:hypothetical protein